MSDSYEVFFTIYKYNTGSGKCGHQTESEVFNTEREAILFYNKLKYWIEETHKDYGNADESAERDAYDFATKYVDDGYLYNLITIDHCSENSRKRIKVRI